MSLNDNPYRVRTACWSHENPILLALRKTVFVDEQGVPLSLERDDQDPLCLHLLATAEGQPVGTGRLSVDGHIGRLAVLSEYRGRGIGNLLLTKLLQEARQQGHSQVMLSAQCQAVSFYARHGFRVKGKDYMEAGIPHRKMTLVLHNVEP